MNHTGINDRTLSEFVISLHEQSKTLAEFKSKLNEVGAEFPDSFIENMDRLILSMHPKHKSKNKSKSTSQANVDQNGKGKGKQSEEDEELERRKRMFPGLSIPDKDVSDLDDATNGSGKGKGKEKNGIDDFMSEFENIASKHRGDRSPKRSRRDDTPPHQSSKRDSRSPPRREVNRHSRENDERENRGRDTRPSSFGGRNPPDEKPVMYKIYEGKVSGMKDFGAFVSLEGLKGKFEGESSENRAGLEVGDEEEEVLKTAQYADRFPFTPLPCFF